MSTLRPLRRWNDPVPSNDSDTTGPVLFCDTETTGLPLDWSAPSSDSANWPRMVELAWRLVDGSGDVLSEFASDVIPDGFTIPPAAVEVHGITTEVATFMGKPLEECLASFLDACAQCSTVVAHNARFDRKIIEAELLRLSLPIPWADQKDRWKCTMLGTTRMCCLPRMKWPRLEELYRHLFHRDPPPGLHSAAVDVDVLAECYLEIQRRGVKL